MKTNNTINDRIIQFVEYLGIDLDVFAHLCDVKSNTILNDTLEPKSQCLEKIIASYPELNPQWVKFGSGSMLGTTQDFYGIFDIELNTSELLRRRMSLSKIQSGVLDRLLIYKSYIRATMTKYEKESTMLLLHNSLSSAIDLLCRTYPNLNPEWLVFGCGNMVYDWGQFGAEAGFGKAKDLPLSNSDKETAEWALRSYGFRWIMSCVKIGMDKWEILTIFGQAQKEIPDIVNTRDGNSLSENTFRSWIYIATQIIPKYLSEYK